MKRGILIGYGVILTVTVMLQSCQDDPILPNGGEGPDADTTWVNDPNNGNWGDSTDWNGGNGEPTDSTINGGDPIDGGNGNWGDSTDWNGGNGDPTDTLG